jgi:hypothetical protein
MKDFEVIIIDNSDEQHVRSLRALITKFRAKKMQIRVIQVDPSKHDCAHNKQIYGNSFNPALSQNIGARKARGDILCLTSPEVINADTNVEIASTIFADGHSRFILGWIDERSLSQVGDLSNGITSSSIKALCVIPGHGAMCRDDNPARPWLPINYFLGFIRKDDFSRIGGMDEQFMRSIAWEDNFFAHCCEQNGLRATFEPSIAGIHLSHSRGYQINLENDNKALWEKLCISTNRANSGRDWGSEKYIVGEF